MNTKEKIFYESIDLFSKKGYNEVSMREIAKAVGIKESSIYYHYSKKEDILDSIFSYFIENITQDDLSEEQENILLNKSPLVFYNYGSEIVKSQFKSLEMIKILRLIFIELYHNDKIKEFFLKEMIENVTNFWTFLFNNLMEKQIIEKSNPKQLAESFCNYSLFKLFQLVVIDYPDDPSEIDIDPIFENIEEHFKILINYNSIKEKEVD